MFSIIIPTYGTKGISLVDNLLYSISIFNNPNLDEIIISDDGSKTETIFGLENIQKRYENIFKIKLIFNPRYHSFSKTVNKGMALANFNNDILLLNNDMVALTSFEPFVDFISHKHNIGIIGAKLLFPNMTIQHAGIDRNKLLFYFDHAHKYQDSKYPPANFPKKYIAVTGACQYINRNLIDIIGYLDDNYVLSFEDIDYCVRAQLNRFDVWYIPDVTMIHNELATRTKEYDFRNYKLFWSKWNKSLHLIDPTIQKDATVLPLMLFGVGLSYFALKKDNKIKNKSRISK